MSLIESLQKFDGKRTSELERLSDSMPRNRDSVAQLLAYAEHDDTAVQVGSTWILKRWLEEGVPQVEKSAAALVQLLKYATYWEVRLHLLQMLASLRVPARTIPGLKKLLPGLLVNDNKFVRAWALSVLAEIADQQETMRKDVILTIRDAANDDAASVRARVRQIQKRYKWTAETGRTKR
ncbi:MAG: hypothetical protein Fues2KO_25040 [Fuerstiella sp.]